MSAYLPEDAGKLWCPFAMSTVVDADKDGRLAYGPTAGHNRLTVYDHQGGVSAEPAHGSRCIAAGCMAWRWKGRKGFCGLIGRA